MVSVQHLLNQCRHCTTIVFGNLGRWPDRVTYYEPDYPYTILLNPTLRLPLSRRRVREMVDVVGRLGNASRRQRPLAHGGSPTLEADFGKTRAALA
ncbi:hypothetical protein TNCV_5035121 [Trichonephila clavipes]|nr:hypothetical protein TNCV_5035121 [Trichonephila clavipes]